MVKIIKEIFLNLNTRAYTIKIFSPLYQPPCSLSLHIFIKLALFGVCGAVIMWGVCGTGASAPLTQLPSRCLYKL